ncbi:MAG: hypothetical protein H0U69_05880 [Trueperaceae bacterium]|nr:hypothetical protein [Trueperaceae bacterium]
MSRFADSRFAPGRSARLLVLVALAALPFAFAQVDERARTLLEGLQPASDMVVDTLDQVMVMTIDAMGEEGTVRTRTIIDYVGERAAIDTELAPGMSARIIIMDGQARMSMSGMMMPLPAVMAETFDGIFDRDTSDMLADGATATYDGVRSYGGLVEGQQVTVSGSTPFAGVEASEESRLLFDGDGNLLAIVVDSSEGEMLMVFDEPFRGNAVVGRSATMYWLRSDGPERFATMAFEDVRINEPIPEGTFD